MNDLKSADNMSEFVQKEQTDQTNKYMQLMSSLPSMLDKEEHLSTVFEIFSDTKPEESSSDSDEDSEDSEEDLKDEKPRPCRLRIDIPS
jgi:hypothetical protein